MPAVQKNSQKTNNQENQAELILETRTENAIKEQKSGNDFGMRCLTACPTDKYYMPLNFTDH